MLQYVIISCLLHFILQVTFPYFLCKDVPVALGIGRQPADAMWAPTEPLVDEDSTLLGIFRHIISLGADVNSRSDEGETPLHKLCYMAHVCS